MGQWGLNNLLKMNKKENTYKAERRSGATNPAGSNELPIRLMLFLNILLTLKRNSILPVHFYFLIDSQKVHYTRANTGIFFIITQYLWLYSGEDWRRKILRKIRPLRDVSTENVTEISLARESMQSSVVHKKNVFKRLLLNHFLSIFFNCLLDICEINKTSQQHRT